MEIKVVTSIWVRDFINGLDTITRLEIENTISHLKKHGHRLSMPEAKPVGKGLWELRVSTDSAIRILYGFCDGYAILVVGFKKQINAIPRHEFDLAQKRVNDYCK